MTLSWIFVRQKEYNKKNNTVGDCPTFRSAWFIVSSSDKRKNVVAGTVASIVRLGRVAADATADILGSFQGTLLQLPKIKVSRFVHTDAKVPAEIYGFADASIRAYRACIYVRTNCAEGLKSRVGSSQLSSKFYILKNISGYHPDQTVNTSGWRVPENIQLADPFFFKPQKIGLLIGGDSFFELLSVGQI